MAFINLERVDTNFGKPLPSSAPFAVMTFWSVQTVVSRVAGLI